MNYPLGRLSDSRRYYKDPETKGRLEKGAGVFSGVSPPTLKSVAVRGRRKHCMVGKGLFCVPCHCVFVDYLYLRMLIIVT